MRYRIPIVLFSALSVMLIPLVSHALSPFVITEIMFNPDGNENAREYVEIINRSPESLSLEGFVIGDGVGFDAVVSVAGGWHVPANGYAVIFDPDYFDGDEPYSSLPADAILFTVGDKAIGSRGLSNSTAECVCLISSTGDTLSAVTYDLGCQPGHSWERIDIFGGDDVSNFSSSRTAGGSPGFVNTVVPSPVDLMFEASDVRFMPLRPVMGGAFELTCVCRNNGNEAAEDVTVTIALDGYGVITENRYDGDLLPGGAEIETNAAMSSLPGGSLSFVLTARDGGGYADTLTVEVDVPLSANSVRINEIMAAPADEGAEWIELMNTGDVLVDLFGFSVSDGSEDGAVAVTSHIMLEAGGYAVLGGGSPTSSVPDDTPLIIMEGFPALNNDGDEITVRDASGTLRDSYGYTGAENGCSLEFIATGHGWDVCTDSSGSTPGRRNSIAFADGHEADSAKLAITPNPFGETCEIACSLPMPRARVNLAVYDRRGRLLIKLRDGEETGSDWSVTWNGRDGDGSRLPAGAYIVNLEALDRSNGSVMTLRRPIVIGAGL